MDPSVLNKNLTVRFPLNLTPATTKRTILIEKAQAPALLGLAPSLSSSETAVNISKINYPTNYNIGNLITNTRIHEAITTQPPTGQFSKISSFRHSNTTNSSIVLPSASFIAASLASPIASATTSTSLSSALESILSSTLPSLTDFNQTYTKNYSSTSFHPSASSSPSSTATTTISTSSLPSTSEISTELLSFQTIAVTIILLIIIFVTIVGNILVCISVCLVRKLRRPCNYLLVSLAVSDLCVAILVMPIALLYEILGTWSFGNLLCDIWVSFDVLCCTASILNLCAISVDRYWSITKPLEYGVKRTPRRMMICVALVWLAAACISLPPLFILGNEHSDKNGEPICMVCQNFGYQIYATLGSFYIPLSVMLFVYYQIFRAARRIVKDEIRAQSHLENASNGGTTKECNKHKLQNNHHSHQQLCLTVLDSHQNQEKQQQQQQHNLSPNKKRSISETSSISIHCNNSNNDTRKSILPGTFHHTKKLRFQLAKERKASTTLGIIMSAFTICWLPFFILALIRPFVEKENRRVIPETLGSLFLWLGYANSLLNPIIYATLNRDFRKPFQEILCFRCSSLNLMMREDFYHSQYGEPPLRVVVASEGQGARESFL